MGQGLPAEQQSARAVREAERAGDQELLVTALALHGAVLAASLGRFDEGEAVFRRLLDLQPPGESSEARARAHSGLGQIANWRGAHETGLQHFQRCLDHVEKHGSLRALAVARLNLGVQLADLDCGEDAVAQLEGALSLSREIGLRNLEVMAIRELGPYTDASGASIKRTRQCRRPSFWRGKQVTPWMPRSPVCAWVNCVRPAASSRKHTPT